MKCNVGSMDKVARIVIGVALIAYAYVGAQPLAYIGIIPLVTGLIGFCPLYALFGLSSCSKKE